MWALFVRGLFCEWVSKYDSNEDQTNQQRCTAAPIMLRALLSPDPRQIRLTSSLAAVHWLC